MTSSKKSERSAKKRRPVRDAEVTQREILDAAEIEFSHHGLNGARISAIADRAGVTTAMIHYYFENKEGLYKAVLQRPATEATAALASLNFDQLPAIEALKLFIQAAIINEVQHPHRQMLWFQEANQNRGDFFKLSKDDWSNAHGCLFRILERGMADGSFRELDPMITTVHILGICIFYFTIQENWKHFTPDVDRLSDDQIKKHTEAAIALVLAGIKAN
jgi:TetR/AcrR family transcriptional regulator